MGELTMEIDGEWWRI